MPPPRQIRKADKKLRKTEKSLQKLIKNDEREEDEDEGGEDEDEEQEEEQEEEEAGGQEERGRGRTDLHFRSACSNQSCPGRGWGYQSQPRITSTTAGKQLRFETFKNNKHREIVSLLLTSERILP